MRLQNSILHGLNGPPAPPAWTHIWRGDVLSVTGANVNSATDQVGTLTISSGAVKPTTVILPGASARRGWRGLSVGAPQYLSGDPLAPEIMTSGAVAYVVLVPAFTPGGAPMLYVAGGLAGAPATTEIAELHFGLIAPPPGEVGRRDAGGVADVIGPAAPLGVLYDVVHTWTPTLSELYLNGALVASNAIVQPTANIQRWTMGGDTGHTFGFPSGAQFGEGRTANVKKTAAEAATFHADRLAYYF